MTSFGVARLACRILALYFLLCLIQPLFSFISLLILAAGGMGKDALGVQSPFLTLAYPIGGVLGYSSIAVLLWFFSDRFAKALVGEANEKIEESHASVEDLATIAFAGIGIYILSSALPYLVRIVFFYFYEDFFIRRETGLIFTEVIRTVIGVCLILRSRGLARIVYEFQEFGLKEPADKGSITPA